MGEIVNLRLKRKRRRRAEKEDAAAANRLAHGRPKAETTKAKLIRALEAKRLAMHRREADEDDRG
jgi:Domain of unknown function (DUF4169)